MPPIINWAHTQNYPYAIFIELYKKLHKNSFLKIQIVMEYCARFRFKRRGQVITSHDDAIETFSVLLALWAGKSPVTD